MRYFQPYYVDATTKNDFFENDEHPKIIFFLSENPDDSAFFENVVRTFCYPLNIYVLCENALQIKEIVSEVIALENIQFECAEIKSDPVAQRELKARLLATKHEESELLNHYLEYPEDNQWVWQGVPLALPM